MENRLREALAVGRFAVTVEVVAPGGARPLGASLEPGLALAAAVAGNPRVAALSVTDRVRADDDHDAISVAVALAAASGTTPVVHLSGKDRSAEQLAWSLGRLAGAGIDNVLCVTGDRLKTPPVDRDVRYLDSVDAVRIARRLVPSALVAAGVSPFKYREEEAVNQYLKMTRKHRAGADYVVTQIGWDMGKLAELMRYRRQRGLAQPVMANFMALAPGLARAIHKGAVPGVVVTDDLLTLIEFEAQAADKGKGARLERLALQMVGAQRLGYAGVQLSGLTTHADVERVLDRAAEHARRLPTVEDWWRAWEEALCLPGGGRARLHPDGGYFMFDAGGAARGPRPGGATTASSAERRRYRLLEAAHLVVFHPRSPVFPVLSALARRVPPESRLASALAWLERRIKEPLVGCRMCGYCRLPETFYVCPETCPKGLANGPCGGSRDNMCEAGDRECVHAAAYRLAKSLGRLDELDRGLVAPVPEPRGGSSWIRHFSGRGMASAGEEGT